MRAEAIPTIRLEVDHMKHSIVSALGVKGSDFEIALTRSIDEALNKINLEEIVREEIVREAKRITHEYFAYGDGHKAIKEALQESLKVTP